MNKSILKTIVTRQSLVDKALSPHAKDIGRVLPVVVDSFEQIGDQIAVIGTDMRTNQEVRVFRSWSRNPRNKSENPMISASKRISSGGVMMFSEVTKVSVAGYDNAWTAEAFVTISKDKTTSDAEIYYDEPVFLDPIASTPSEKNYQVYNIIQADRSISIENAKGFFSAFADFFKTRTSVDDSVIIRGYSKAEGIASSIRVLFDPKESFKEAMERIIREDFYIDMVGQVENTYTVNGNELITSLEDKAESDLWEIIPVQGIRKNLSPKDEKLADSLTAKANSLLPEFLYEGETTTNGFRNCVIGIKTTPSPNGRSYSDIVTLYHEHVPARPLSLIDTPYVSGLVTDLPGFTPTIAPTSEQTTDMGDDFMGYIAEFASSMEQEGIDFLQQPGLEGYIENAPSDAAPTPAKDDGERFDFLGDQDWDDVDPEAAQAPLEIENLDDLDIEIDIDGLSDNSEASEVSPPVAEQSPDDLDDLDFEVDISGFDDTDEADVITAKDEPVEANVPALEDDLDIEIDIDALSDVPAEPEQIEAVEIAPVETQAAVSVPKAPAQAEATVSDLTKQQDHASDEVSLFEESNDFEDFSAEDFLADGQSENEEEITSADDVSLASSEPNNNDSTTEDKQEDDFDKFINEAFSSISSAFK